MLGWWENVDDLLSRPRQKLGERQRVVLRGGGGRSSQRLCLLRPHEARSFTLRRT